MCEQKKPHLHAEVIKAWADGAEIQVRGCRMATDHSWHDTSEPTWSMKCAYRVKPEKKSPGQLLYECVWPCSTWEHHGPEYQRAFQDNASRVIKSLKEHGYV